MSTYPPDQMPAGSLDGIQLDPITSRKLQRFAHRRNLLLLGRAIAGGLVVFVAAMTLVAICDYLWVIPDGIRALLSGVGYVLTLAAMWAFGFRSLGAHDDKHAAVHMQAASPKLKDDLLSAVELANPADANGSPVFRERLQGRVARRVVGMDVRELLPLHLIRRWLTTGIAVAAVCVLLMLIPQIQFGRRIARAMLPGVPIERASQTTILIVRPNPPTGYVAQGDAVAVVVQIGGAKTDDVRLVWQSDDGVTGETKMSPRVRPAIQLGNKQSKTKSDPLLADELATDGQQNPERTMLRTTDTFAANLSVGASPIEYQIYAGDAISLWNRLTPLPRPRVNLFNKRYRFPDYAKLSDREEQDEHGDLKALSGTMADISVEFDQPVTDVIIRFANVGGEIAMDAADGSQQVYTASIPIKTASQYQVDAVSIQSGLSNPFSPSYTIVPVVDTAPVARWAESIRDMTVVSPLAVLDLAGSVQDDLPVDTIVQEFMVNGKDTQQLELPVSSPSRDAQPSWRWDLMKRNGQNDASPKLSGGDIVRTRLVAIDRRGRRGESRIVDLLIAEDQFSEDRHQQLAQLSELAEKLTAWTASAAVVGLQLREIGQSDDAQGLANLRQLYAELNERTSTVIESIAIAIENSQQVTDTNSLEMAGRAIIELDGELQYLVNELSNALNVDSEQWESARKKIAKRISYEGTRASHQAGRLDTLMRSMVSHELSLALARDVSALRNSLRPLLDREAAVPADRWERYVTVTLGRMKLIDELITRHDAFLLDSTRAHYNGENWSRWAERWTILLTRMQEDQPPEKNQRDLISRFDSELQQKSATGMADGRLMQLYNESFRDLRREMRSYGNLVGQIRRDGSDAQRDAERAEKEDDAKKVVVANFDTQQSLASYQNRVEQIATRLSAESQLHRRRPRVDLQHAADLTLLRRAIENVNQDGFLPYRDEPATDVHENLAGAIRVLESTHEADLLNQELGQLLNAERALIDSAETRLGSGVWIQRYSLAGEWSVKQWQEAKLDWGKLIEPFDQTRYDGDFKAASDRLTRRRWDRNAPVSAEVALTKLTTRTNQSLRDFQPLNIAARKTIERYVLSLPEQARQAAQEARDAKQRTDDRPDSDDQTAEQLAEKQEEAESAAEQTVQALIDQANTADLLDDEQREIARDADAAATAVNEATKEASEAMQQATSAANEQQRNEALELAEQKLEALAETLEKTAEHFEDIENGENVDQSRKELRQAEEDLQIANELEERYEDAEAMANAANSDPKELLKQLEAELQKNEPMQKELSEIAENAAQSAQKTLEQAESDERSVNQALERSDAAAQEAKRRTAKKLEELARRLDTTKNRILGTAEDASGWANEPKTRDKVSDAREALEEAVKKVQQMGGENALAEEIKQTIKDVNESIKLASASIADAEKEAANASERNVHNSELARKNTQNSMEGKARTMRNQVVQDLNKERGKWSSEEQEANRRVQLAQRQQRGARDQRQRAEDRLKKEDRIKKADPKKSNPAQIEQLKEQVEQLRQREDVAEKAEQAADQTRQYAKDQRKRAEDKTKQVQREKQERLTQPSPAAQLVEESAKQASRELAEVGKELSDINKQLGEQPDLESPADRAEQLAGQQERINSDVESAADQVARAARHESRLGEEVNAQQLDAAAESIQENGLQAGQNAKESLQQASGKSGKADEAGQKVAEAKERIGAEAKRLAEMLGAQSASEEGSQQDGQPSGEQSTSEQQGSPQDAQSQSQQSPSQQSSANAASSSAEKARKMAQTLDELDRSIAESEKQSQQSGEQQSDQQQGSQEQGSEQPSGEPQNGQESGEEQSSDQPSDNKNGKKTAGQASPTLSQMLDAQSQQAAKDRQQQLQPGNNSQASQEQGDADQSQKEGDAMTQNAGPGEAPGDGEGLSGQPFPMDAGEWGTLRERKTNDDASESREARVAPQYRREVQAYFRAIAKRAAAKSKAAKSNVGEKSK